MQCISLIGDAHDETPDATPKTLILFGVNPNSSINGRVTVTCRRPSDGATKFWSFQAGMNADADRNAANLGNQSVTPFGLAGHLTALAATPEAAKLRVLKARAALTRGDA